MKRTLFLLISFFMVILGLANTSFYYYNGEKILLDENPNRVSLIHKITACGTNLKELVPETMLEIQTIKDDLYDIIVVEHQNPTDTLTMHSILNEISEIVNDSSIIYLPCYKTKEGEDVVLTNYLNVELKNAEDYHLLMSYADKYDLDIIKHDEFLPLWYILTITPQTRKTSLEVANELFETGFFASSVADFCSNDILISYDPLVFNQWGLYNFNYPNIDISVSSAWNYATGNGARIGILDTGVDMTHQDLAGNIFNMGFDTESGSYGSVIYNNSEHGTHCAGIAAAVRNNGIQITGVAPDSKLVSISNSLLGTTNSRLKRADGIMWAYQNDIDIISNSWHSGTMHSAIDQAIYYAINYGRNGRGCVVVFAAGNAGNGIPVSYPANCNDSILAVGAIDVTGTVASFSQTGTKLDVVAPGVEILSTIPGNGVAYKSGTSMACPHVAGLAALILSRNPQLTVIQVNNIIESNTKKVGNIQYDTYKPNGTWNSYYGYGLIDAYQAIVNTPVN